MLIKPSLAEMTLSDLNAAVETLLAELQQIKATAVALRDADALKKFEQEMHAKTTRLADLLSAIKLQEALNSSDLDEAEKELIKSHPKKMKNMGQRAVNVRMLGGTSVSVSATYYHQKTAIKKKEQ